MGAAGRNEPCGFGSGRKAKRCCGVQRGPSEADLARAFLAGQVGPAARVLRGCSDDELNELQAETLELPTLDTSLQLPLPRLLTPDVERLLLAIEVTTSTGSTTPFPPCWHGWTPPSPEPSSAGPCSHCVSEVGSIPG